MICRHLEKDSFKKLQNHTNSEDSNNRNTYTAHYQLNYKMKYNTEKGVILLAPNSIARQLQHFA